MPRAPPSVGASARLRRDPPGAQAPGRDAAAAVGGVRRRPSELAYKYTSFCIKYRAWAREPEALDAPDPRRRREAVRRLRRPDRADHRRGHRRDHARAQIFVAVLGASNYTYACATATQTDGRLDRRAHRRAGVLRRRAAADRARPAPRADRAARPLRARRRTAPVRGVLPTHYGVARAAGPARVIRGTSPRSKSRCWSSSAGSSRGCATGASSAWPSSTRAIARAARRAERSGRSRSCPAAGASAFERLDQPALRPLPASALCRSRASSASRVNIDYHVEFDGHYYSVPHRLVRAEVELRVTGTTVEMPSRPAARGVPRRAAPSRGGFTTVAEHMPASHRAHREWTPAKLIAWGERIGVATAAVVTLAAGAPPASRARLPRLPGPAAPGAQVRRPSGWKPPARGRWRSARPPSAASTRSSSSGLDRQPLPLRADGRPRCRCTRTCAAPTTTTDPPPKEKLDAERTHPRPTAAACASTAWSRALEEQATSTAAGRARLRRAPRRCWCSARSPGAMTGASGPAAQGRQAQGQQRLHRGHRLARLARPRPRASSPRWPAATGCATRRTS